MFALDAHFGGIFVFVEASGGGYVDAGGGGAISSSSNVGLAIAMAGIALAVTVIYSRRGSLKSPWFRRRKHALIPRKWNALFDLNGRFLDGGVKFLKKVRSGGVDPSIRAEVWPFLLGLYDVKSSKRERDMIRAKKRKEYVSLRRKCMQISKRGEKCSKKNDSSGNNNSGNSIEISEVMDSLGQEYFGFRTSHSAEEESPPREYIIRRSESLPCRQISEQGEMSFKQMETSGNNSDGGNSEISQVVDSMDPEVVSARVSHSVEESNPVCEAYDRRCASLPATVEDSNSIAKEEKDEDVSAIIDGTTSEGETDSVTSEEVDDTKPLLALHEAEESDLDERVESYLCKLYSMPKTETVEDYGTWQQIIRIDAIRANSDWIIYSPSQAAVSEAKALRLAERVGLKDYDHLEPCKIFHAARLVAILEAYALYDSDIGYCQGMSDLLSPIIAVMEKDYEAFWCFVGFMRKARHNFRLDEMGIRRQLNIVSRIIKSKDSHLYRHLEKLEAEDCFFVYRMVVVLFRRELDFEQTLSLWEIMWADQAAVRTGIVKSSWERIRQRAPPTDDLLLYAIAACVLQRKKLIIEKYSSMEEIMTECNTLAGNLDVWKLLDDAHDLVVAVHDKL